MIDELLKVLKKSDKRIFIQTHDFPDPDAIASAFGLQNFMENFGISSQITYCGDIQREALKTMISDLHINVEKYCNNISEEDLIVIVDGCKGSKNVTDLPGFEIAVIDHHIVSEPEDVPYLQIEESTGSCSTIITTYFIEKNLTIQKDVASALKIGISRDTDLLTRKVTDKDVNAFHYLYSYADNEMVSKHLRNNIQLSDFAFFNKAINSLKRYKNIAWLYFDQGCETNLMGILGDFILSAKEINLFIFFAKNNNSISISVRNENPQWSASEAVRVMTKSIGAGGGHKEMAGGVIFSSNDFSPETSVNRVLDFFNE